MAGLGPFGQPFGLPLGFLPRDVCLAIIPPGRGIPSAEEYKAAYEIPTFMDAAWHIYWTLNGPLSTSIYVLQDPQDTDSPREPFFPPGFCSQHLIGREALTEPPVSSVTVTVDPLYNFLDDWLDMHSHAIPGEEHEGCGYRFTEVGPGEEDDGGDWEGYKLMRCCGEKRPTDFEPVVVKASTLEKGGEGGYVTIFDYIATLHPRIMRHRRAILRAKGLYTNEEKPLPESTRLVAPLLSPDHVTVYEKNWLDSLPLFWKRARESPKNDVEEGDSAWKEAWGDRNPAGFPFMLRGEEFKQMLGESDGLHGFVGNSVKAG